MWDARFDSIRDRKLNEMVIFSAMVRTDPGRRREYVGLIDHLALDLDVLDALIAGKELPKSEPIASKLYRSRLSKYEALDEYVMDQCRKGLVPDGIEEPEKQSRLEAAEPKPEIEAPEESPKLSKAEE